MPLIFVKGPGGVLTPVQGNADGVLAVGGRDQAGNIIPFEVDANGVAILGGIASDGSIVPIQVDNSGIVQIGGSVMETPHVLLDGSVNSDTTASSPNVGSLIQGLDRGDGVAQWQEFPTGIAKQFLRVQANGTLAWETVKNVFTLQATMQTSSAPADSTTYYAAQAGSAIVYTQDLACRVFIPRACTLIAAYGIGIVATVLGSAETITVSVRKNGTTDTLLSNTFKLNAAQNLLAATGLSTAFAAGDWFSVKHVFPAWVTNPTGVMLSYTLMFEYDVP